MAMILKRVKLIEVRCRFSEEIKKDLNNTPYQSSRKVFKAISLTLTREKWTCRPAKKIESRRQRREVEKIHLMFEKEAGKITLP
jgi:predicted lipid carrier protein YhbT